MPGTIRIINRCYKCPEYRIRTKSAFDEMIQRNSYFLWGFFKLGQLINEFQQAV